METNIKFILDRHLLKKLHTADSQSLFGGDILTLLNVDQFYGIELEEFPARISEVALWLTDHQMNLELGEAFGKVPERLPLRQSARIVIDNALHINWDSVMEGEKPTYILGNPPFIGSKFMTPAQREDILALFPHVTGNGTIDYVSGWYAKAAGYIQGSDIEVAFVSTNSITQGEQVGILWNYLLTDYNIVLNFAHKTFKWKNDAQGVAGVYCVIIGFGRHDRPKKYVYEYASVAGEPLEIAVNRINPYLADAPDVFITSRSNPICDVPEMAFGSMPNDGGHLLMTTEEKNQLVNEEPHATEFIRRFVSAKEFINGGEKWCLWLEDIAPDKLRSMPAVMRIIERVKEHRLSSTRQTTNELAAQPALFGEMRQPTTEYIVVPRVSSENRKYIPIGFFTPDTIVGDTCMSIPNGTLYHFGILTSMMHMTWMRTVAGRLESRYRYSNKIVYNNFPWPHEMSDDTKHKVEQAAQTVLDTRKKYVTATLADLYDPNTMPADLLKAHHALDRAVDKCYRTKAFTDEHERISFLFEMYQKLTNAQQN